MISFLLKCLLLIAFVQFSIEADIITLKNGSTLEGTYLSEENGKLKFDVDGTTRLISKSEIQKMEMGYTGSSFCYVLEGQDEICEGVLHYVDKDRIIIGKGKGMVQKETFSLSSLKSYSVRRLRKNDKITSVIQQGIRIEIVSKNDKKMGRVLRVEPSQGQLTILSENIEYTFAEDEIEEINWVKDSRGFGYYALQSLKFTIPGLLEYPVNKWEGIGMMSAFGLLAVAIPLEYSAAVKASQGQDTYLVYNGNLVVLNGLGGNGGFSSHKNFYYGAIGGMGVLYMAHSFEVYRYTKQGKYGPEEDTISFGINRLPTIGAGISTKNITFSPNPIHNTQFELKFSHSF